MTDICFKARGSAARLQSKDSYLQPLFQGNRMNVALTIDHARHVEMFDCIASMIGNLAALSNPMSTTELNARMDRGTVFRLTTAVGLAGPLGIMVQGVQPDGSVFDVVNIDAPPRDWPFHFN
jgi:hypothetical protein